MMTQNLKEKKKQIKEYATKMEKIIEGSENLVFVSWKDQQEGIGKPKSIYLIYLYIFLEIK